MKKFKTIILTAGVLSLCSIGISSCNDDDEYDFPGDPNNHVFNTDYSASYKVIHTPLFSISNLDAKIPVKCSKKASGDISATFAIDNSLIEAYNEEHETNYAAMPDGVIVLENATMTIPAGQMSCSDTLHITTTDDNTLLSSLNSMDGYLIPVKMTNVSGGGGLPSTNMTPVSYLVVTITNDNIQHGASETDITGIKVADQSGWTATTNATSNADKVASYLFDGNETNYTSFQNKDEDLWINIDMGREYTFDALTLAYGYYSSWSQTTSYYGQLTANIKFETSSDGTTWNSVGDFENGDNNRYMIFYAPITARYIKMTVKNTGGFYGARVLAGEFNIFAK